LETTPFGYLEQIRSKRGIRKQEEHCHQPGNNGAPSPFSRVS
jgi:hypothetical protein